MRRHLLPIALLLLSFVPFRLSTAQVAPMLRGTVTDSANHQPVPGAVITVRDSGGVTLARAITTDQGAYAVEFRPAARRIQILRIGYRPRETAVGRNATRLDVTLAAIPMTLEAVRTSANSQCRARVDATAAAALLEHARAGLLATVVAREANPATVTLLAFDRSIDAATDKILGQRVRIVENSHATGSFNASHSAEDFVSSGFVHDSAGAQTFFGPDAEVLLDDAFSRHYCFGTTRDPQRVNQIGLTFAPATRQKGRVDIEGSLWVDTVARALRGIEFKYVGFDNNVLEGFNPGGRVAFHEMANGVVLIDRWSMRLVGAADTTREAKSGTIVSSGYALREVGGQLARAAWSDGRTWTANLASVRITSTTPTKLPAGSVIALDSTDYRAVVDSAGVAAITDVLPGPYEVSVVDPRLASLGILVPTALSFEARGDAMQLSLAMPSAEHYVAAACRSQAEPTGTTWLMGRITGSDGRPLAGARWKVNALVSGSWQPVADGGITGSSGLFAFCRDLRMGDTYQVQAWRDGERPEVILRRATENLTIVPLRLRTVVASAGPVHVLRGSLVSALNGGPVPRAQVSVSGKPLRAMTDAAGRFEIAGVPYGEQTLEVRTWSLDSLGAVSQSSVVFADTLKPVALRLPTMSAFAKAMCTLDSGVTGTLLGDGVIVGSIEMRGDSIVPPAVRVLAEWSDAGAGGKPGKSHWVQTRSDMRGAYRLCGVPTNTPMIVRAEASDAAAVPLSVQVAEASHFTRAELTLDRNLRATAAFVGLVMTDSTRSPLGGTEIALPKLSKHVVTNDRGSFRVTDIPPGTYDVNVRHVGYGALQTPLTFAANQTLERKIILGRSLTLETFNVVAEADEAAASIPGFEENRKLGLGAFLTRSELERQEGRRLSDAIAQMKGTGVAQGSSSRGFIMSTRQPPSLPKCANPSETAPMHGVNSGKTYANCGTLSSASGDAGTGVYCPESPTEQLQGILCGCYAQVYVDGSLMNRGNPTPPFNVNEIEIASIEAIEFYASPALTPMRYSQLSPCGVLVIWSRRSAGDVRSLSGSSSGR
jgi:hypothetical protein